VSSYTDEVCDVYNERERRAVKDHQCQACKETIRAGDASHCRIFILFEGDEGEPRAVIRCLRCQKIHMHLRTLAPGEMWPDEKLDCGEEYTQHWGKEPPAEIAELAFVSQEEMQIREQARILSKRAK
jgi:hypothetical protein